MKTKIGVKNQNAEQPHGINYSFADSRGRMHLGRSVGSGRDRAHAERRFFKQHRHVLADEAGFTIDALPLIIGLVSLFTCIVILAVQLETQLNDAHLDAQALRGAVLQLSHENNSLKARVEVLEGRAK